MNPTTYAETAVADAIRAMQTWCPGIAGPQVVQALDEAADKLPQIIVRCGARESIAYNHTYEIQCVVGVVTSANPKECSPGDARRLAHDLGRLLVGRAFATELANAGLGQMQPFALAADPRATEAATVEVEGRYAYMQAETILFQIQF